MDATAAHSNLFCRGYVAALFDAVLNLDPNLKEWVEVCEVRTSSDDCIADRVRLKTECARLGLLSASAEDFIKKDIEWRVPYAKNPAQVL